MPRSKGLVRLVALVLAVLCCAVAPPLAAQDLRDGGVVFPLDTMGTLMIAWFPDGERLAALTSEGAVEIRSASDGRLISRFDSGETLAASILLSPDGRHGLVWSAEGVLRLLDMADGRHVARFEQVQSVVAPAFSRDGSLLAVTQGEGRLLIVSLNEAGRVLAQLETAGRFSSADFAPDHRKLLTTEVVAGAEDDGLLTVWSVAEAKADVKVPFEKGQPLVAAYAPDGRDILVLHRGREPNPEQTATIVEASSGEKRKALDVPGEANGRFSFRGDGARALINTFNGPPTVWRLPEWVLEQRLGDEGTSTSKSGGTFAGNRNMMMVRSSKGGLQFYAGETPFEILRRGAKVKDSDIRMAVISPDGQKLAVLAEDLPPEIWSLTRLGVVAAAVEAGDVEALLAEAELRDTAGTTRGAEDVWGLITLRFPGTPAADRANAKLEEKKAAFRGAIEAGADTEMLEDEKKLAAFAPSALRKSDWMTGCLAGTNIELDVPGEESGEACSCVHDEMKTRLSADHFRNLFLGTAAESLPLIAAATRLLIRKEQGLGTYIAALQSATDEVKRVCKFKWGH